MAELPSTYDHPVQIAVIGGTGLSDLPHFTKIAALNITTPWGKPASPITILEHPSPTTGKPIPIAFLARHGIHHQLAPHEVPVRANMAALRSVGVRTVIAFSAVGSLQEHIKPRDFVVPDQIIDRTKGNRPFTFFEDGVVGHVPFADPFDHGIGQLVRVCGHSLEGDGVVLHDKATVICIGTSSPPQQHTTSRHATNDFIEGPQFSTRAESHLYRSWGGGIINMSALPEAKLAREAELAYQMICMSTDYDCWHSASADVSVEMVMGHMKANAVNARRFVSAVLDELSKEEHGELVQARHLQSSVKFSLSTAGEGWTDAARSRLDWLFPGYFTSNS